MLSNDDHPGLFTFLLGLIVLVMAGVVLSMLVDRRFGASKKVTELGKDIEAGDAEIGRLGNLQDTSVLRLADEEPARRTAAAELQTFRQRADTLEGRRKILEASVNDLRTSLPALEEDFKHYRGKYREFVRVHAPGRELGTLRCRSGREYQRAVIIRVTDGGIEIRHDTGNSTIPFQDLDPSLQEYFQWDGKGT